MQTHKMNNLSRTTFKLLLEQAIFDYSECTEDDERSEVVQKLINDLENQQ